MREWIAVIWRALSVSRFKVFDIASSEFQVQVTLFFFSGRDDSSVWEFLHYTCDLRANGGVLFFIY